MLSGTSSVDWQLLLDSLTFGWAKTLVEISELWKKIKLSDLKEEKRCQEKVKEM